MAEPTDPTMKVRVEGDISNLEGKLKDAEKAVDKSGKSMGSAVEKNLTDVANKLGSKIAKMIGAGFAIKALDDSLKIIADGIKHGKGAEEIALAIGDSILEGLRRVPVAGALGDILAMVFDPLLGDPKKIKEAREKYGQAQMQAQSRQTSLRRIRMMGATPEEAIQLKAEQDIMAAEAELQKALSTIQATGERKFDQIGFDMAVEEAMKRMYPGQNIAQMGKSDVARIRQQVEATINREQFLMAPGYTPEAQAEMAELTSAAERAKETIRARADEELAKLRARTSPAVSGVEDGDAMPDIAEPPADIEGAVEDLAEDMELRGSDTSIFESRMIGIANDQLMELKGIRQGIDNMASNPGGFR